ncbi:DUF2786 domain-containing protein [Amycolatopsis rubida]|uniref:DUF2786 domain-containing protein n=1 Tax=Amycolatopsis rubida TaxID=112413 RepID=A0ABX0BZJ1_9PSEU|nr:DUF2786 domain-containing protein [Amycolatopsis sp. M39]MYW96018.1 DUF2786 domain-containing protein [Amycolatopsis rubida]NEC61009.1 DUF2786 domain-containing protein [Amycolatopsis rubida]OAP20553.1 hypothetical protein A4R44_08713 [Amycolatopsis sp. M39]
MATNANITERVQKLLAKAEDSAATPEEAQIFAAKAAELIAKHNLDAATVRHREGKRPEQIRLLEFEVSGQGWHGKARASLVYSVAEAHGCSVCTMGNLMNGKPRWVLIMGPAATLKALELLLPSILLQAETQGMAAARAHMDERKGKFDTPANANIERRTFFRSYLPAYGAGVAEKIVRSREAMAEKVKGKAGELVLVTDAERTKAAFEKRYPDLKFGREDKHNIAGAVAGRRDGRNADTGQAKVGKDSRTAVEN